MYILFKGKPDSAIKGTTRFTLLLELSIAEID